MKLKPITTIEARQLKEQRAKAVYRDHNGNLISTHKLSKADKRLLGLHVPEDEPKTKEAPVYTLVAVGSVLLIILLYLI